MSHMIWVIWYDSYPEYYWPSLSWVVNLVKNFVFRPKMTDNQPIRWTPLESNPDVFNSYMAKLGVPASWVSCHRPITTISSWISAIQRCLWIWSWIIDDDPTAMRCIYFIISNHWKNWKVQENFQKQNFQNFKRLVSFLMLGNFEYIKGMNKKKVWNLRSEHQMWNGWNKQLEMHAVLLAFFILW